MRTIIHNNSDLKIVEFISNKIILRNVQDSLDLMVEAGEKNARNMILYEYNINPDFFKLKTGLAGEILQKFVNYYVKLAIVGNFEKYKSKSLKSFIIECNNSNQFFFVSSISEAIERLNKV